MLCGVADAAAAAADAGRTNAGLIKEAIASIARGDRMAVEGGPKKLEVELKVIEGAIVDHGRIDCFTATDWH